MNIIRRNFRALECVHGHVTKYPNCKQKFPSKSAMLDLFLYKRSAILNN